MGVTLGNKDHKWGLGTMRNIFLRFEERMFVIGEIMGINTVGFN